MKIITELITPFNKKEIDYVSFNKFIETNNNDYILIFSNYGEGNFLSLEEKKSLINSINNSYMNKIIYYLQLNNYSLDNQEINLINNSNIKYVMLSPIKNYNYTQEGLYLYIKKIINQLKNKYIILHNSQLNNNINFHFLTISKLINNNKNIIALYEEGVDYSLINLIKDKYKNIKLYVNENLIEYCLDNNLNGIVSLTSLVLNNDLITIIDDYNHHFKNNLLINYFLFVHEILSFSNNSTLIKAYLKKLGYPSTDVRLPLLIEKSDIENLDFLLS
ncbi:MAG: dihydrodipicolinate synthase family protein [Bacilli bacterium]